jgi:hypothetical protein
MKKIMIMTVASFAMLAMARAGYADTLTGTVKSINPGGNAMTIVSQANQNGEATEYKLVWDKDFAQLAPLENARIGQPITVEATQNAVTRNWKVASVGNAVETAQNALLRGREQTLNGEVTDIDTGARSLTITSKDTDENGNPMRYKVVWDSDNPNVRERLEKARVGDRLTVRAEQNVISRNWKATSIAGPIAAMGARDVKTISGEVTKVNPEKNYLVLSTTDQNGKQVERKIVWSKDFAEQAKLETARIGQHLSVQADQNMITRNWRVKSLA